MMRPTRAQFPKYTNSSIFKIIRITQSKKWAGDINRCFPKKDLQMANRHVKRCSTLLTIKEMKIKTTIRYHLTPVRMVIIKKSTNYRSWRGCRKKGILLHCWWECKLIVTRDNNSMEIPYESKNSYYMILQS